jgi:hypothetical protein
MKKENFHLIGLALGAACAALLLAWFWQQDRAAQQAVVAATTPTDRALIIPPIRPTGPSAAQQAARELLATLERVFANTQRRAHEAVLTFKDDAAQRRFLARAQKAGLNIIAQSDALRTVRVRYENFRGLEGDLLDHADDYASVSANTLVGIPQIPAKENRAAIDQVPFRNRTLNFLGVTDNAEWGRGTVIAILDTGVAPDATFGGGRLRTLDIGLGSTPGNGPEDGHGTAIAALAAGGAPDAAGVAPSANLLSIRVTDASGTSDIFTVAQGIVAAVDAGARIINVSLGGYSTGAVLEGALAYATDHGALVVAAAGNDQAAQLAWPAADPRVISVGAVDAAEQQVTFSNSSAQLQLAAPGYGVQTAWLDGQRAYVDGTSASAPLVAGAIAALISRNPSLTPLQAAQLLEQTANDGGAPGADAAYGRGILNLATAMNSGNAGYIDTAVSSHYYDAANNQLDIVVQNRSGRAVTGMTLNVNVGGNTATQTVPSLAAGETYVAKVPVDQTALRTSGALTYSTQLINPIGVADQMPANNKRSSVLTPAPTPTTAPSP